MYTLQLYVLPSMRLLTPPSTLRLDYAHDVGAEEVVACVRRFRLIRVSYTCRKPDTYQTSVIVNYIPSTGAILRIWKGIRRKDPISILSKSKEFSCNIRVVQNSIIDDSILLLCYVIQSGKYLRQFEVS
jgi:hypothetical protein